MSTIWLRGAHILPASGHMVVGGFSASIGVWPVALGHRVGMVWTGGGGWNWADASWVGNVRNDYGGYDETWSVSVNFNADHPVHFEFALYLVESNGNWVWANTYGNNYSVSGLGW